ncbi:MAG: hypothetical protein AAF204_01445 [Pseudomonadota bacterium]
MPHSGELRLKGFEEAPNTEDHVRRDLERIFSPQENPEALIEHHVERTVGRGWRRLNLEFEKSEEAEETTVYYMPATGDPKALVAIFTGCEGSALLSTRPINEFREQGISFLQFSQLTRDQCDGDVEKQIALNAAINAEMTYSPHSPLHVIRHRDNAPASVVAQSSGLTYSAYNLLDDEYAEQALDFMQRFDAVVPFAGASRVSSAMPFKGLDLTERLMKRVKRNTLRAIYTSYATSRWAEDKPLGDGPLDWLTLERQKLLMPTHAEAVALDEFAAQVVHAHAQRTDELGNPDQGNPVVRLKSTFWISANDNAACPKTAKYKAELIGADVRIDQDATHENGLKRWLSRSMNAQAFITGETPAKQPSLRPEEPRTPSLSDHTPLLEQT